MAIRKHWFVYFALALFELFAVYSLWNAVKDVTQTQPPGRYAGLCVLAALWIAVHIAARLLARWNLAQKIPRTARRAILAERIIVAVVLAVSAAVRIFAIVKLPIAPSSDYQTYYQVAGLLVKGGLSGSGYAGYIAEFPHVIGYPFVLSLLFRVTGASLAAGLALNLAAGLFGVYITFRIARALCGRLGGMVALVAAAFWPSQILYGTILGSEPVFTCLLLLCIWLFVYLYRYPVRLGNRESAVFLCCALGALIALANAVRPMAEIFLIAVILCVVPFTARFNKNEKMLNGRLGRFACQGWFLALVITLSFLICNRLISASVSSAVAYRLPTGAVSYGFNLMVGVNIGAKGAWNQQDADFFAKVFAATNSPQAAHQAGVGVAVSRIQSDPVGIAKLALEKFSLLWGNDDYAGTWTTLFLQQQGNLTPERQAIIRAFTGWNDYYYLSGIFFSAVFGIQALRRKGTGPEQALILLCIGTAALHMLLESQNRYHYFILPVFAIFAAMSIAQTYRGYTAPKSAGQQHGTDRII